MTYIIIIYYYINHNSFYVFCTYTKYASNNSKLILMWLQFLFVLDTSTLIIGTYQANQSHT